MQFKVDAKTAELSRARQELQAAIREREAAIRQRDTATSEWFLISRPVYVTPKYKETRHTFAY